MKAFADLFKKGVPEDEIDTLHRSIRAATNVNDMLGTAGWDALRIRYAEEIESELRMLLSDVRLGKMSAEAMQLRMLPILGAVANLEVINQVLAEGDVSAQKLKKIVEDKKESSISIEEMALSAT
jgi:hypothetical protein